MNKRGREVEEIGPAMPPPKEEDIGPVLPPPEEEEGAGPPPPPQTEAAAYIEEEDQGPVAPPVADSAETTEAADNVPQQRQKKVKSTYGTSTSIVLIFRSSRVRADLPRCFAK